MRLIYFLLATIVLAFTPAYAASIPFTGSWSGAAFPFDSSFASLIGPGFNASIQMYDVDWFGAQGGNSPGQMYFVSTNLLGGQASTSGTPCFSQVSCSGASVNLTYNGLNYYTWSFSGPCRHHL
jgi:hypothetical protein